ncbi:hypothetical protein H4J02_12815 [Protaetiibacter sp. SSC-01]|uniref:DUF6498-containing protein n=1 Tax=Protaetiibacter sp. SSC-01 TaxID=2759943 RepID=UPI001656A449|nr:DUF6498-containing protein [Protaetiibacter sp. SSC-01]QNO37299.1 hypothetical protein H4J02_12815 [Protaetiibacter sp. SSC-01]
MSVRAPGAAASASVRSPLLWIDVALYVVLPLVGLLWWGWDWRPIVLLYWLENVTIGGVTFIRLRRRAKAGTDGGGFPASFFLMHYGIFTAVHGVFVIVLIAISPVITGVKAAPFNPLWVVLAWIVATLVQWYSALRSDPVPRASVGRAYARVLVLHAIVLGAVWLITALGLPSIVAIALVVLHAIVDVVAIVLGALVGGGRYRFVPTGTSSWALQRVPDRERDPASEP